MEATEPKLYRGLLSDLRGSRLSRHNPALQRLWRYVRQHRTELIIATLSLLLVWQWHTARMATLRAEMAERDMDLNARQAIRLSDAVLKAQDSHDRLERAVSGYSLPSPR